MNYEEFEAKMIARAEIFAEARDLICEIRDVHKTNETLKAICFKENENGVSPMIYIKKCWQDYDAEDINAFAFGMFTSTINNIPEELTRFTKPEYDPSRIIACMVNAKLNKDLLAEVPHRMWLGDIAIIYRFIVSKEGNYSFVINNSVIKAWGINESKLHMRAEVNAVAGFAAADIVDFNGMIAITNKIQLFGAGVLADDYHFHLCKIAHKHEFKKALVVPMSVHDFAVMPIDNLNDEELEELVNDLREQLASSVDDGIITEREFLSSELFMFEYDEEEDEGELRWY